MRNTASSQMFKLPLDNKFGHSSKNPSSSVDEAEAVVKRCVMHRFRARNVGPRSLIRLLLALAFLMSTILLVYKLIIWSVWSDSSPERVSIQESILQPFAAIASAASSLFKVTMVNAQRIDMKVMGMNPEEGAKLASAMKLGEVEVKHIMKSYGQKQLNQSFPSHVPWLKKYQESFFLSYYASEMNSSMNPATTPISMNKLYFSPQEQKAMPSFFIQTDELSTRLINLAKLTS
mmetsp:Transcript_29356/g.44260  ORF Transcript_29356/g.44260 Transcript_29356/m.44260 type:complete len:233 (-) Transcript_29356:12244-12942(-)